MYVICFYWQGDRWQQYGYKEQEGRVNRQQHFIEKVGCVEDYLPAKYVNNLYKGVKRFTNKPFKFICFTNEPLKLNPDIEVRPFRMVTREGIIPRMYMFSREAGLFGHQVLCLDLDIVIVGSLKRIMDYDGLFCARSKFKMGEEWKLDGDIIGFRAGEETENLLWNPFIKDVRWAEQVTGGRERYWFRRVVGDIADRWDQVAPKQIVSYKRHVRKNSDSPLPPAARIVSCHGTPRPHQIQKEWIKQYWK